MHCLKNFVGNFVGNFVELGPFLPKPCFWNGRYQGPRQL
jgi:hypothetical protein